jgi:predicted  nucleic acid-binding Zn-ribbon protein
MNEKSSLETLTKQPKSSVEELVRQMEVLDSTISDRIASIGFLKKGISKLDTEIRSLSTKMDESMQKLAKQQSAYLDIVKTNLTSTAEGGGRLEKLPGDPPLTLEPQKDTNGRFGNAGTGVYNVKYGDKIVGTFSDVTKGETIERGFKANMSHFPNKGSKFVTNLNSLNGKNKSVIAYWSTFDSIFAVSGSTSRVTANSGTAVQKMSAIARLESLRKLEAEASKRLESNQSLEKLKAQLIEEEALVKKADAKKLKIASRQSVIEAANAEQETKIKAANERIAAIDAEWETLKAQKLEKDVAAQKVLEQYGRDVGGVDLPLKERLQNAYQRNHADAQAIEERIAKAQAELTATTAADSARIEQLKEQLAAINPEKVHPDHIQSLNNEIAEAQRRLQTNADKLARLNVAQANRGPLPPNTELISIADQVNQARANVETRNAARPELQKPKVGGMLVGFAGILAIGGIASVLGASLGLTDDTTSLSNDLVLNSILNSELEMRQGLAALAAANNALMTYLVNTP